MNNKDRTDDSLFDFFLSETSPSLTDVVVDAFLASAAQAPVESGKRVMALFVRRVLADLHKDPVKTVEQESFGRWIETVRRKARLTLADIGGAIGRDATFIAQLESGAIWPWASDSHDIARLIALFRLHIDAASALVQRSFTLSKAQITGNVVARAHGGKMTKERGSSTRRALDMFLARNAKAEQLDESIIEWLAELRTRLEDRGERALLH
jgi:transcriptional regulator with XRE-family HTH domain